MIETIQKALLISLSLSSQAEGVHPLVEPGRQDRNYTPFLGVCNLCSDLEDHLELEVDI
jgi:hypothetical protein